MKTLSITDDANGQDRDVQLGEEVFAYRGAAAARAEAGTVITRCREAVRLRFADGVTLLAFGVSLDPAEQERIAA